MKNLRDMKFELTSLSKTIIHLNVAFLFILIGNELIDPIYLNLMTYPHIISQLFIIYNKYKNDKSCKLGCLICTKYRPSYKVNFGHLFIVPYLLTISYKYILVNHQIFIGVAIGIIIFHINRSIEYYFHIKSVLNIN